jgi:hypothetical protein
MQFEKCSHLAHLRLHLNDKHYYVEPPERERIASEEMNKLGDVRSLVAQVSGTEQK